MAKIDNIAKQNAEQWLSSKAIDQNTKDVINDMMAKNIEEFNESFYRNLEFGTGGLRGIMGIGTNRMNQYTVAMATQGFVNYIIKSNPNKQIKTVISFDNRNNSKEFAQITARVMAANGFKVSLFKELRPTPVLSFAVRHLNCDAGVMVTASHNPKEYNGYKAYWNDGGQLVSPHDDLVIEEVIKISDYSQVKIQDNDNNITIIDNTFDNIYFDELLKLSLNPEIIKKHSDIKICYTSLHGTGITMVPKALDLFGFKNIHIVKEQAVVDGNFPTAKSPNPEERSAMELGLKLAKEIDADVLLATDPDADRVGIAVKDQSGDFILINGNQTATVLTYYILKQLKEQGKLKGNEYTIKTIVTSELIKKVSESFGVKNYDVFTGFKFIADRILSLEGKEKYICGGEESYGFSIGDFVRDKDAISGCCLIAEVCAWAKEEGKTFFDILLDIYLEYGFYKEDLLSITKKGISGAEEIKEMMHAFRENPPKTLIGLEVVKIKDYQKQITIDIKTKEEDKLKFPKSNVLQFFLEDGSKISVRPSGTEPKIKFYFGVFNKLNSIKEFPELSKQADAKIQAIIKELGLSKN
ncbi:MAG: phospho-sugar mutase [Bacteroidales bacterium]|nr:phospho-sugar mutase [Bacteroidales bacterium]MDD4685187.1 phospho-sugar mutase [Bacteroidales bacterium]